VLTKFCSSVTPVYGTPDTCLEKANLCVPGERDEHEVDNTFHPRTNFIPRNISSQTDFVSLFVLATSYNDELVFYIQLVLRKHTCAMCMFGDRHVHEVDNTFHPRTNFIPRNVSSRTDFVSLFVWATLYNDEWAFYILVLRTQTCAMCMVTSRMSTRLTTPFILIHFIPPWFVVCLFVWLRNDDWGYLWFFLCFLLISY
jgi:hypothetical protein